MRAWARALRDWAASWFAWRTVRSAGCWVYQENAITGKRRMFMMGPDCGAGYEPGDWEWLDTGIFSAPPRAVPRQPSSVSPRPGG